MIFAFNWSNGTHIANANLILPEFIILKLAEIQG